LRPHSTPRKHGAKNHLRSQRHRSNGTIPKLARSEATNGPITAFAAEGLPEGLLLNSLTGMISGKPVTPGTFDVRISAANLNGSGPAQALRITVTPPPGAPILTVPSHIFFYASQPFSLQLEALGMPVNKPWAGGNGNFAENLPNGMSLNSATGVLSGFPSSVSFWQGYSVYFYAVANGLRSKLW